MKRTGCAGGKTYAADHATELKNHVGAIETDGGSDHPIGLNIKGRPEIKAFLAPVGKNARLPSAPAS